MVQQIFTFHLEPSWQKTLKEELNQPYVAELAAFVEREYETSPSPIYPPKDLIFNAFYQTPFKQTEVVIVGQDPYHGPNQAHGLSFSVPVGVKQPPSLQNIFKELKSDLDIPPPSNGCLIPWAKQGVLLLNAILTVRKGDPLSHHGIGWERFTDDVIRTLQQRKDPVIFVLWGKSAQDKGRFLREPGAPTHHFILTAAHPSPYSANNGFFGCRHFSKINELLIKQGKKTIDWSIPNIKS
jgi:uracil-DNA glycosylase